MLDIHFVGNGIALQEIEEEKAKFVTRAITVLMRNGITRSESAVEIARALLALYSGKRRHYHTYAHINKMFGYADEFFPAKGGGNKLEAPELLAILFHDCIYVPGQADNEGRSVDLMTAMMAGYGVPLSGFDWASRIVAETANFLGVVEDESTHAVLDLDLAAFADPWELFLKQNTLVEREFPNAKVEDRINFLEAMLNKNKLYYKLCKLQVAAKENIAKYIKLLKDNKTHS